MADRIPTEYQRTSGKRRFTNEDLARREPMTVTRQAPLDRRYTDVLNAPNYIDDVLASARASLARSEPLSRTAGELREAQAASGVARERAEKTPMPTERDALRALLVPATFAGGPAGVGAAGALSALGLGEAWAERDPGRAALETGFALMPFGAGRWMRRGRPSQAVAKAGETAKAENVGRVSEKFPYRTVRSTEKPYRMTAETGPAYQPSAFRQAMDAPDPGMSVVGDVAQSQGMPSAEDVRALVGSIPATQSRQSIRALEDALAEVADREFWGMRPAASRLTPNPPVQRIPAGRGGDEYTSIRESGGAFRQPPLSPEEAAAEDEFWSEIATRYFGR